MPRRIFRAKGKGGSGSCNDCVIEEVIIVSPSQMLLRDQSGDKINVKCTLVQALRLCTGRTAYRGS